jgi:NAD-dependent dihydropyrimidine dehydrogenase PreA subunit
MGIMAWLRRRLAAAPQPAAGAPLGSASMRRLPVIEQDLCSGCGLCVQACEQHCLELIWDFATLTRPEACGGAGRCVEACPEQLIRIEWAPQGERKPAGS